MVAQDHITVDEWTQAEPQAAEGTEAPGRVGIVGLGLIGGSLARRLATTHCEVLAWNHRAEPYADAQRYGIRCMEHLEDLVLAKPDVLVLCNPLSAMPDILHRIAPVIDPDATTLTDVGSVKGLVRDQVNEAGLDHCYVGAHPMAGNELSGWRAADPQLFDKALWAVTFGDNTAYGRVLQVASMITQLCMNRLIIVDDATHDRAAAQISHMPHAIATMLANMLIDNPDRNIAMSLAAGSWRDMTRVALTDPHRTQAMVEENSGDVEQLLREVIRRVTRLADALRPRRPVPLGARHGARRHRGTPYGNHFRFPRSARRPLARGPARIRGARRTYHSFYRPAPRHYGAGHRAVMLTVPAAPGVSGAREQA